MKPKNKVYAAGVIDRNDDWTWQGSVVAGSFDEARKMLSAFRKKKGIQGSCAITTFHGPHFTDRKKGISHTTNLF